MAGCLTGIAHVEVKAPNGKPSLLFQNLLSYYQGDVDSSYLSYLQSQSRRFDRLRTVTNIDENGELFATVVVNELNVNPLDTFFSKPLQDNAERKPGSVMQELLKSAKLIIDPKVDEQGNQADSYGITTSPGGAPLTFVGRVSNLLGQFSLHKKERLKPDGTPYASLTEAIVYNEAGRLFKGKGPDDKVEIERIEYTKQEYIDFKKAVYQQGQVKGDLIHALLQRQIALINGQDTEVAALNNKINELEIKSSVRPGAYNWVVEKKNFQAIMKNAGIEIDKKIPHDLRDKVYSEIPVADMDLGVAGKIDTLVEKANGRLKVVDYKTGNRLDNNKLTSRIMLYGNSGESIIYDNGISRAKLQTMMYSLLIKANHPDVQMDAPIVVHIPNESKAKSPQNIHQVEVRDYLKMIENFYRNENKEVYDRLVAKSPHIFDPTHYGSSRNTSFTQDMIDDKTGMRADEKLQQYELELEQLITANSIKGTEDNYKGRLDTTELKRRDELVQKILQAKSTLALPAGSGNITNLEISTMTKWLGTINDTHNPYIQAYAQVVNEARLKTYREFGEVEAKFNSLLTEVLEEKLGKRGVLSKAFKWTDKQAIFENMIHETSTIDPTDGQERISRGLVRETDPEWVRLSAAEKALVRYMREQMKGVFEHVLVKGPNAGVYEKNGKMVTKLDIYNTSKGASFKWSDDFIPKIGITSGEVKQNALKNGFSGIQEYVKHELAKRLSMFYEENIEGDNQNDYGIPVKYIGTGTTIFNPDTHSSNLELAFKKYMQHMINKKHYDQVYALGDAVKGFLEIQKDSRGNAANKNAADFLGFHMQKNLIGRINEDSNLWRKKFQVGTAADGKPIYLSPIKFGRSVSSGIASATLWLKVPAAAKNAGQALWSISKESLVTSLVATEWGGVSVDKQDLSAANHAKAWGLWAEYQKEAMLGRGKAHPVHAFIKEFRMFPEIAEMGTHRNSLLTSGGTAYDANHLGVLYSYPEQATTAVLGLDALMAMKIQTGTYKGKSLWDVYSSSVVVDAKTGEGKFELPLDFSRGKLRMGDGTLQELKGLNHLEMQKLHRVVQRVKGGYRTEERTMLEASALGEMFMLFRRWLPATIVNGFKSSYYDPSMGYLAKTEQEDIYQWQSRLAEGRFRTMAGVIGNMVGMSKRGYNWADLSDLQKRNVLDMGLTVSTWGTLALLSSVLFGDLPEDDTVKKWSEDMTMRIGEQWNPLMMAEAAVQPPAVIQRSLDVLSGLAAMSMATASMASDGSEDDIYTKRGELKGSAKVLKNLPVVASFYDVEKFIEGSEYLESGE